MKHTVSRIGLLTFFAQPSPPGRSIDNSFVVSRKLFFFLNFMPHWLTLASVTCDQIVFIAIFRERIAFTLTFGFHFVSVAKNVVCLFSHL